MQRTDFAIWHNASQLKWGLFFSSTDKCLKTKLFNIILALFRQLHALTIMKRVQKQKHLITTIPFLLLARSSMLVLLLKWQPPLKQLPWSVSSCPDRGIFSSICTRISMSHLSIVPFIRPQWGISPALTLIQLLYVLMTLWPPVDRGHKFNCTWRNDSCLPVTDKEKTQTVYASRWLRVCGLCTVIYLSWLKLRSSLLANWPYVSPRKSGMSLQSCPMKEIFKKKRQKINWVK